jgi:nicotinamidase-related amidase
MPVKNPNLHGSAPDKSRTALLLIDVINPLEFPEADQLGSFVPAMARNIWRLKQRALKARVPVIYVNDNFGRWRSDFRHLVDYCLQGKSRAARMVKLLQPGSRDYFVLKPKHSGFFATSLETLLGYLGVRRLILTGIAGNFCVLFTANDAYMRDYEITVAPDCVISNTLKENRQALELMATALKADLLVSDRIKLSRSRTPSRE